MILDPAIGLVVFWAVFIESDYARLNAIFLHHTGNPSSTARYTLTLKRMVDTRTAIAALPPSMHLFDLFKQDCIIRLAGCRVPLFPGVKSATRDAQVVA